MNYQEVVQALDAILTAKKREIEGFSQYSGGWENWLKIEMTGKWSFGQVFPEQHVWDDKRQIDLWFPDTRFGVELKCLGLNRIAHKEHIISEIASTYRQFAEDALLNVEKNQDHPPGRHRHGHRGHPDLVAGRTPGHAQVRTQQPNLRLGLHGQRRLRRRDQPQPLPLEGLRLGDGALGQRRTGSNISSLVFHGSPPMLAMTLANASLPAR